MNRRTITPPMRVLISDQHLGDRYADNVERAAIIHMVAQAELAAVTEVVAYGPPDETPEWVVDIYNETGHALNVAWYEFYSAARDEETYDGIDNPDGFTTSEIMGFAERAVTEGRFTTVEFV